MTHAELPNKVAGLLGEGVVTSIDVGSVTGGLMDNAQCNQQSGLPIAFRMPRPDLVGVVLRADSWIAQHEVQR